MSLQDIALKFVSTGLSLFKEGIWNKLRQIVCPKKKQLRLPIYFEVQFFIYEKVLVSKLAFGRFLN